MAQAETVCGSPELPLMSVHVFFTDAASLCCSFTIGRSGSEPWWFKVQGHLKGDTFVPYKDKETHAIDVVKNKPNATKICQKRVETWRDEDYLFKQVLYQIRKETNTIRGKFQMAP